MPFITIRLHNLAGHKSSKRVTNLGVFISFEGGDGAGKTTQIKALQMKLEQMGVTAVTTREPGGTPSGEILRDLILNPPDKGWSARAEALLFYADRAHHIDTLISPALKRGDWVICDRYCDSTMAYQVANGLDEAYIRSLQNLTVEEAMPDLTFILDVSETVAMARMTKRGSAPDALEKRDKTYHEKVRSIFRDIAANNPDRCVLIDAGKDIDAIAEMVWAEMLSRFPERLQNG